MGRTDSASRVVGAAPDAVFAALLDARSRERWLPPTGMTGRFDWFDPRPGGGYRLVLTYDSPAGVGKSGEDSDVAEVRFVVVEPGRVVEEADFVSDDPRFAGTMTITWTIDKRETGSLVSVTAADVPVGIGKADHEVGLASTLANLAAHLA